MRQQNRETRDRNLYAFLDYISGYTYEEVGKSIGLTKERVRQICAKQFEEWLPDDATPIWQRSADDTSARRKRLVELVRYARPVDLMRLERLWQEAI